MYHAWKGEPCMYHAWKGEAHACIMHGRENHAHSMHGMVDLCMYHACIMHDTCIHAWNMLKHACFMYRISSREGLRTRLEYYTPLKKALFCSLKVHTLKKFADAHSVAKLLPIFISSTSRGTAWPLHFKFASYTYGVHCRMLITAEPFVTSRTSAEPDTCRSILLFTLQNFPQGSKI